MKTSASPLPLRRPHVRAWRFALIVASSLAGLLVASCDDREGLATETTSLSPFAYPEVSCSTDADCTLATVVKDCVMCCTFGTRSVRDTDRVRADYVRVREVCNSEPQGDASAPKGFSVCPSICSYTAACREGQCTTVLCPGGGRCSPDAG